MRSRRDPSPGGPAGLGAHPLVFVIRAPAIKYKPSGNPYKPSGNPSTLRHLAVD